MNEKTKIIEAMIEYFQKDIKRINHFIKVHAYADLICDMKEIEATTKRRIEMAAIVHDIGIKNSEEKYGSSSGHYQQIEGPPEAEKLLEKIGVDKQTIQRICWLVAHHHTYDNIREIDHQILVEADFLVNIHEDAMASSDIEHVKKTIFKTESGIILLEKMFGY